MLRITAARNDHSLVLKLEGRVEGPWVALLGKTWTDAMGRDRGPKVIADVGGVAFADSGGRQLLLAMQKRGVVLANLSGFLRESLESSVSNSDRANSQD